MSTLRRLLPLIACWGLATPASALAVGGPIQPVQGGAGVTMPGVSASFVAMRAGRETRIDRMRAGTVEASRLLPGHLGVPGVGLDGSTTGLSADGRTLVVAGNPAEHGTRLVVLDAQRLGAPAREISLPGFFTVDAVSPDGATIFLVHYLSPSRDILRYEVRAYDVAAGRMAGGPIVDPREPDEKMQGIAITRATSPDGRWAYTLYGGEQNFVHALDTAGRKAFCIDLDGSPRDISSATLRLGGGTLHVGTFATIDTRTLKVSRASAPAPRATSAPPADGRDGGPAWLALALVPVAAAALAFAATRLGRRRSAGSRPRSTPVR
jgi:hypothetical protein